MRHVATSFALLLLLAGCNDQPPERTAAKPVEPAAAAAAAPTPAVAAPATAPVTTPTPAAPTIVYRFDPQTFQATGGPFTSTLDKGPNGPRQKIAITGGGWNVYLLLTDVLRGDREYLAQLDYEVITPPVFPATFHMFARSKSLGMERDAWLDWVGDAGARGTVRLPMRLPPASDWTFSLGCKGPAELYVERFTISEGTGFAFTPAGTAVTAPTAATATPAAAIPLPTGCPAVTIDPPAAGSGLVLTAKDFGLVADGATPVTAEVAQANAAGLAKAIAACKARKASRLELGGGTYRVETKDQLTFDGLQDLTIDGQGATLVFTKLMKSGAAIIITNNQRVVVRDLRVDWDWTLAPIASLAVVRSIAPDLKSCTLDFPQLDAAGVAKLTSVNWMGFSPMDPQTLLFTSEPGCKPQITTREPHGTSMDVGFTTPQQPLVVGRSYMLRHLYYDMILFKISESSHLHFDKVTIHSFPGMGWLARGDTDHLALTGCRVAATHGRPLSTAADVFHIGESKGHILLQDCSFANSGDDCVNIHDSCAQGVRVTGTSSLVLVNNMRWRMRVAVGDRLEFFTAEYQPIGFTGTVAKVSWTGNDTLVDFAEQLPAKLSPLTITFNRRYGSDDVRIAGCHFSHGRVMLSSARATIEDCVFDHPFANAVQLHTEIVNTLWSEGSGASNMIIRNNDFRAANIRGKFLGAVIHGAPVLPAGRTTYALFHDILIEGNRFADSRGPVVALGACRNVTIRGNTIAAPAAVPGANALAGSVLVERSSAVDAGGNTWLAGAGQRLPGVLVDPLTTSGVQAGGNKLER